MVGAGLMEKIMNSSGRSKLGHAKIEDRALADAELGAVTGGMLCLNVGDVNVGGLQRSIPNGKTDVIKVMGNTSPE